MQRLNVLRVVLVLVLATIVGRLYQLQLVNSDERRYGRTVEVNTTRYVPVRPRRGEILARDGTTLLAESVPTFSVAILPARLPPPDTPQRAHILAQVAQITSISSTLTLSPTSALDAHPDLRGTLAGVLGNTALEQAADLQAQSPAPPSSPPYLTMTVAPSATLAALELAQTHPDLLRFDNPIADRIEQHSTRHYETVVVKEVVPPQMALALRENLAHLPGVEVIENYQRRYPLSADVPTLSHLLGYIGRINECELVTENPATSWLDSLLDTIGHAPTCGLVQRTIDPGVMGIPPYQHDDRIGKDGLEASYEAELRGEMGIETLLVDALERPVSANRTMRPVQDGNNLVLTIDPAFQQTTAVILQRWLSEADRRRATMQEQYKRDYHPITSGVAVVMDPRNGNVLAMVSLPAYDNNVWVDPARTADLQALLAPDDPQQREELQRLSPLTNRAIAGLYPAGSSVKQFVGAAALHKEIIQANTLLRDPGRIVLEERSGHTFVLPNSSPRDNGNISISDALMVSSNVFFASIAGGNNEAINLGDDDLRIRGLRIDGLAEGLEWFGFGTPTSIRLPGEARGRVPGPVWKSHVLREPWTTGDTYNTAIGQGYMEVTPLQLATAASAVANGGTLYRPQLVQHITNTRGEVVARQQPEVLARVPIDDAHLAVVREGMRRSVTEGVNVAARDACSGLSIAGKTGTAEYGALIIKEDGSVSRRSHAWFVGFAPYEQPEVLVVVLLEGAGDLGDGSATLAVPAVTQIMQAYFHIPPTPEDKWPALCPHLPT